MSLDQGRFGAKREKEEYLIHEKRRVIFLRSLPSMNKPFVKQLNSFESKVSDKASFMDRDLRLLELSPATLVFDHRC